jgi:flagellar motor switch protein FliN/FliY
MSEQDFDEQGAAVAVGGAPMTLGALAMVEADLTVLIGHARRPIRELLEMRPGSVVSLDRAPSDPVEILANGTLVAHGEMVVVDGGLGVRITEIVTDERARP